MPASLFLISSFGDDAFDDNYPEKHDGNGNIYDEKVSNTDNSPSASTL